MHARAVESHDFEDDRRVSMFEHKNMMSSSAPLIKRAAVVDGIFQSAGSYNAREEVSVLSYVVTRVSVAMITCV